MELLFDIKSLTSTVNSKSQSNLRALTIKDQFLLSPRISSTKYDQNAFFRYKIYHLNAIACNTSKNQENPGPFELALIEKVKTNQSKPFATLKEYRIRKQLENDEIIKKYRDLLVSKLFNF